MEPLQLQYDCHTAIFVSLSRPDDTGGKWIFCGLYRISESSHHCVSTDWRSRRNPRAVPRAFFDRSHAARSADSERLHPLRRAGGESAHGEARVNNAWQVFDRWLSLDETTPATLFKARPNFVRMWRVFDRPPRVAWICDTIAGWSMRIAQKQRAFARFISCEDNSGN